MSSCSLPLAHAQMCACIFVQMRGGDAGALMLLLTCVGSTLEPGTETGRYCVASGQLLVYQQEYVASWACQQRALITRFYRATNSICNVLVQVADVEHRCGLKSGKAVMMQLPGEGVVLAPVQRCGGLRQQQQTRSTAASFDFVLGS